MIPTASFPVALPSASPLHMQSNNEGLFPNGHRLRKQTLFYGLAIWLLSLAGNNRCIFQLHLHKRSLCFIAFINIASWIAQFVTNLYCQLPLWLNWICNEIEATFHLCTLLNTLIITRQIWYFSKYLGHGEGGKWLLLGKSNNWIRHARAFLHLFY